MYGVLSGKTWVESSDGVLRDFQGVDRRGLASTCKKLHPSHSLLLQFLGDKVDKMQMFQGILQRQEWSSKEFYRGDFRQEGVSE